jgi:DNA/RNA non-specific endonuclease
MKKLKPAITAPLLFCCLLLQVLYSCRKLDTPAPSLIPAVESNGFFENHPPTDPMVIAARQFVMGQNEKYHFKNSLQKKIGLPYWSKAISFKAAQSTAGRGETPAIDSSIVYVPFVRETETAVNTTLAIKMKDNDTSFRIIADWEYKSFGYEQSTAGKWNGRDVFHLFAMLNYEVFNTTRFQLLDYRLLPDQVLASIDQDKIARDEVNIVLTLTDSMVASRLQNQQAISVCNDYSYCVEYQKKAFRENSGQSTLSQAAPCAVWGAYTICTTYWVEMGGGSGGDPDNGSGGGGGGEGWNPPICETEGSGSHTPIDGEPCDPGWNPLADLPITGPRVNVWLADFEGVTTYITSSGVAIKLAPTDSITIFQNIDLDIFPNGALYGFVKNGVSYVAVQEGFITPSSMVSPKPEYTRFYKITDMDGGKVVDYSSPYVFGPGDYPTPDADGMIKAVRIRQVRDETTNQCVVVKQLVEYRPDAGVPTDANMGNQVTYDVEDLPLALDNVTVAEPITCTGPSTYAPPANQQKTIDTYFSSRKTEVVSFIQNKLHSTVKVYLYNCETNKVKYTLNGAGSATMSATNQTLEMNKFNNGSFGAADEDIHIAGCIQNGQWTYNVKLNYTKLGAPDTKIAPYSNQVIAEIKAQVESEVAALKTAGKKRAVEEYSVENGERFFKESMDLMEAAATLWDIGKSIYKDAKMPEWIWDQGRRTSGTDNAVKAQYDKSAIKMPSIPSGATDQLIDEATGVLQLVKTGYQFVRHPGETFNSIWKGVKSLNGDKIKQLLASASGYDNYVAGGDRSKYQGGKHAVQVAMLLLGPVKALTTGRDVVKKGGEGVTDLQKFIPDGTVNHTATNAIKNAADNGKLVKNINNEKLLTRNLNNGEETLVSIEKNGVTSEVFEAKKTDFLDDNGNQLSDVAIDELLEDGAKDVDLPLNADASYKRGQKGGWNKDLNTHPLTPNKIYDIDGFKYHTDAQGRVTKLEIANLQKSTPAWDRNGYQQSLKANKVKDGVPGQDQGGHLLAAQFGGPGEQINLVPMKKTLNQAPGPWAAMEQEWANTLNGSGTVTNIEINISYGANGRPTTFVVSGYVNGSYTQWDHIN